MKKFILVWMMFLTSVFGYDATIEVVKKNVKLPFVAVEKTSSLGVESAINEKFYKIILGDLKVSSNFKVYDEKILSKEFTSSFSDDVLYNKGVELILRYELAYQLDGSLGAAVKVVNLRTNDILYTKNYRILDKEKYIFLAHKVAVDLNDSLKLPSISWMSRFVLVSKYTNPKEAQIVVSDYTLSYEKKIVTYGLNLFPKWANNEQTSFYYTSYNSKLPTLYKVDLATGSREKIISSPGMLVCSDVSEDGEKLLLTMAPQDQTDIYLYNLKTKTKERITNYQGIDVSGSFVDNDSRVVFVSDRLGYPNIFAKNMGQSAVEQMVYMGKNNNSCSSFGKYIVYSSREKMSEFGSHTFNLYLISTQSEFIRQLTATGVNVYPRFSADGESIMFIKNYGNQSALGIIRLSYNKSFHFPLKSGKIQSLDW